MTSREELLANGGIYPFVVPLDWVLIGANGEREAIPAVQGSSFHRILAKGALLATEPNENPQPEVAMTRQVRYAPFGQQVFDRYVDDVINALRGQQHEPRLAEKTILQKSELSPKPFGKAIIQRVSRDDRRTEIHYLLADRANATWELVYLVRADSQQRWSPLLAALEAAT